MKTTIKSIKEVLNTILPIISIILTIPILILSYKTYKLTQIQAIAPKIEQNKSKLEAVKRCKNNPKPDTSGLRYTNGKEVPCSEVLKLYGDKY